MYVQIIHNKHKITCKRVYQYTPLRSVSRFLHSVRFSELQFRAVYQEISMLWTKLTLKDDDLPSIHKASSRTKGDVEQATTLRSAGTIKMLQVGADFGVQGGIRSGTNLAQSEIELALERTEIQKSELNF